MGPSPQPWAGNWFRSIAGWPKRGDLNADGLHAGFYSAYSHDEEEGMARVFDQEKTPGVDIWTYRYHPTDIPMGSGAASKGYVEMWGGTSKLYGDELTDLAYGTSIHWTEWMYAYQKTTGLTFANRDLAGKFSTDSANRRVTVGVCPSGAWQGELELKIDGGRTLKQWTVTADPGRSFFQQISLGDITPAELSLLRLTLSTAGNSIQVLKPEAIQ